MHAVKLKAYTLLEKLDASHFTIPWLSPKHKELMMHWGVHLINWSKYIHVSSAKDDVSAAKVIQHKAQDTLSKMVP